MITMRNQYKSLKTVYESTQEQEAINRLEKKINQLYEMLRKQTSVKGSIKSAALAAAGATFVGLVLSLSVAVYNWYIKKYAIECMKTKGLVKKKCLVKLQMSAKKQQILVLQKKMTFCVATPKPIECKFKMKRKISSVSDDIRNLKEKYKNTK